MSMINSDVGSHSVVLQVISLANEERNNISKNSMQRYTFFQILVEKLLKLSNRISHPPHFTWHNDLPSDRSCTVVVTMVEFDSIAWLVHQNSWGVFQLIYACFNFIADSMFFAPPIQRFPDTLMLSTFR